MHENPFILVYIKFILYKIVNPFFLDSFIKKIYMLHITYFTLRLIVNCAFRHNIEFLEMQIEYSKIYVIILDIADF